jgi:hypothetical protein
MADFTFESFFDRLVEIENKTGAIDAKFDGVQLYPLLRVRIFYAIATGLGLFEDPHPSKPGPSQPAKPPAGFNGLAQTPVVVLPFKRQVGSTDPYSDRIIELLGQPGNTLPGVGQTMRILPFEGDDDSAPSVKRIRAYAAEKFMASTVAVIKNHNNLEKNTRRWLDIIEPLEAAFGVPLDSVRKYPPNALRMAFNEGQAFAEYFKAVGAKHLYVVNAYSETAIVLGAKQAGVKVHEIQHGFITKLHAAYSYPKRLGMRRKVSNAPDSILLWGAFWGDDVPFAAGVEPIVTGPTAAFSEYRAKVQRENRIVAKQVLFTSQGAIATQLLTAAIKTAVAMPDHKIIYRLHPNENLEDYAELAKQVLAATGAGNTTNSDAMPANFGFSHRDPIFLDLVSQSEYLVGAFSTTLYEGLALGCKVLVLPLPGFEHVKRAIALGDMTLVDNLDELPKYFGKVKQVADATRYYA